MALVLFADPADRPAYFGVEAARFAARSGARLLHLPARFDLARDADAEQYVFAEGGLGPSGLFFAERMLGRPVEPTADIARIVEAAREADVVVPIHDRLGQDPHGLRAAAQAAGITVLDVLAAREDAGLLPLARHHGTDLLPITLLGTEHDHRTVYPAALVSLEDAASSLGLGIDIRFLDPRRLDDGDLTAEIAGLLLPGGSDMANVAGQIRAARHGLAQTIPVLGLCLGMQTMTTAFAQTILGETTVNLTEADPGAEVKSFVAMADERTAGLAPLPVHRTGEHIVEVAAGTRLAELSKASTMSIRCNHRYRLAPALRMDVEAAGLVINATSHDGRIADGIELPDHPFYIGFQGHPELGHPDGAPHPLFAAFLRAARDHANRFSIEMETT